MRKQWIMFVFLALGLVMGSVFSSPASAQSHESCEAYRLQGAFCAQINMYQTLLAEAYAQQPPVSSPHYNVWMQRVHCLQSMQNVAYQYCSQFGGDGTFPMCTHEYSPGWSCQALSHYANFLAQLNSLPPTNDYPTIIERDRLRTCLTFIVNNLQANCRNGQFNVPSYNPVNDGGGGFSDPAGGGTPGHPGGAPINTPYTNPQPGQGNPGHSPSPVKPGIGGSQMEECEFMTTIIDIADHCTRAQLLLEKIERLQSQGQLSDFCRQRLQQMYMDESRRCEEQGGNPTGQPYPVPLRPLKPSGQPFTSGTPANDLPVDRPADPCDFMALPDVADPCVLARYVFEMWATAQQRGASPNCLHKLKKLFYEKQEACRKFGQKENPSPYLPEQPW